MEGASKELLLADDQMCFVCGKRNAHGFQLSFNHEAPGVLSADVIFKKEHQGFQNIVHGGIVATLLDEMIVNLAWKEGVLAVSVEIQVRLKKPVKVAEKIHFEGRIAPLQLSRRMFQGISTATDSNARLLAKATITCLRVKAP